MSNPTDLPGRSTLVLKLSKAPLAPAEAHAARRRNEVAYESTVAVQELPTAHVAWEALTDRVLVTATQMDVLAEWLFVMSGQITTTVLPWGQTVWTLHTRTWSDSAEFPSVPVHVSVTVSSDEPVMEEVRLAVRR
ncbi:hypothetical protein SGLAM104S_01572 [Streptomyces glaucescens]